MKDNQLKPVHYLVKHEEIKYNQKNDCHPILADYGEDQFSIRMNSKGEDIHIKPLDSFSFQSIVPFESKYKRPTKNQAKSLLQQSTILNDTDILSDEDELNLSQNMKKPQNKTKEQTLAIQYPTESDYCNQQIPFFDPSFFKYKRYFHYFFLPEDTEITIESINVQQKQDSVLQKVYQWLEKNERPLQQDQKIASNSFLSVYYKLFYQLYIKHDTKIIHNINYPNLHDSNPNQQHKICLPFTLFHAAFNKLHAHGHSGIKISIKAFNQFYFIPYLHKWMSIFIYDCIEVNKTNILIKKFKLQVYKHFPKMLPTLIIEFL